MQLLDNFLFFESDFDAANSSGVKFKGLPFSLLELDEQNAQSLILVFKVSFFSLVISKLCVSDKVVQKKVNNQHIPVF